MPMDAMEIKQHIQSAFPDATVQLVDLAGDNDHFQVTVLSGEFRGKSRVQQHKMVFDALQGSMKDRLHALSIKTGLPPHEPME